MQPRSTTGTLRDGDTYDVIVVGARVAGAATAMLLARAGLRVVVLDHAAPGSDALSTHALMRAGVLQLSRWGLLKDIVAAGTPPVRRTTFQYGGERIVISIKPTVGVDALYAPRRTLLDPLIVRAAEEAGAAVHHRTSVIGLIRRDGRVIGVRATTVDGSMIELRAPLVVGADGIRSSVASLTGAAVVRSGTSTSATTYGYFHGLETDGYEWNFEPDACSGVIPTNDGAACVFVGATPARIGRGGVGLIHEIIAESAPELSERLARATPPAGARTWAGQPGFVRRAWGPGWALVGDAGYFKDPLSAHGLTDALRDAELVARAVTSGFGRQAVLDTALAEYESLRDRLSLPLFDVVERIAAQQWSTAEIGSLLMELSSAMTDEVEFLSGLDTGPEQGLDTRFSSVAVR
ncbi:MAG: NAD(P)/FAD-dependent oxidoreductase [Ilumatobacteraceae bacterium]